ncbi:MAG: YjbQ family protein [Candidatus Gastranaerophilales bacterium]|nr:YjbQ family protein [Candidatus Gastranaerophilales bacterium]
MAAVVEKFNISSKGFDDLIDITLKVQNIVALSKINQGMVNVCAVSSTAGIMILESEPALGFDISKMLEAIAPINKVYQHDNLWHDGNAYAHLKGSLVGNNITIPVVDSKAVMTFSQRIVLVDFDNKPSEREIFVSVVG